MIKLLFTTLTPLHISNGEQLGYGLDYVIRNDAAFCKIDFLKVSDIFATINLFDFKKAYSLDDIIEIINKHKKELPDNCFTYKVLITRPFHKEITNERSTGQNFVSEFINSNGKFYIPASSVKGVLRTVLGMSDNEGIGVNVSDPKITDRFVIQDSSIIPQDRFNIFVTNERPPKVNLMCLKKGVDFEIPIQRLGILSNDALKEKLSSYSSNQIKLALDNIRPFKSNTDEPKGADIFEESLQRILNEKLNSNEYLINLGFGGGSWFKVREGIIPKFDKKGKNRGRNPETEAAHTTFSINNANPMHIGWCKLRIEEE
jgi:CRISPR/Cas system CSM-associated protein Csm5 (group 7 of RAMP superfamily)